MLDIKLLKSPHPFAANTYLVQCGDEYAIVDPTTPYNPDICDKGIKYILLTHAHFDHILEVESWAINTEAKVIATEECASALSDPMRNCYKLYNGTDNGYFGEVTVVEEGEELSIGTDKIRVMKTPGHTAGSAIYLIDDVAFVGDTVFESGGYGRFDLPTGNFVMLKDSILKIMRLPDDIVMYPGHGGCTTVKQYKKDFRG
jgi:glyoxylase-like metal-dependent hydrolase (beta-lactamase superfamily II)